MGKVANGQTIIQAFEQFSPKSYAVDGDKVGLMIGTLNKPVKKVMIALDVLEEVIDEAITKKVDLIIAHHPLIFRPLKKIDVDAAQGKIIEKAIKHDITIYSAHTNLDIAIGGVNDMMADALGLLETEVLSPTYEDSLFKLVVFVPITHEEEVRKALGNSGAGHIGNYSHCSFTSIGRGAFRPGENTSPFIGESGKLEYVDEVKIETIIPRSLRSSVLKALWKAHPYEEPAYDIIPLENKGAVLGLGRIGKLTEEMTLEQFANHVKNVFKVDGARVVGPLSAKVKKVAVLGGDGNKYIYDALRKGADVLVTGDVYYHVAHDAMMAGLHIVDPGHNVEKIMKHGVGEYVRRFALENKISLEVLESEINTDPFTFV